MADAETQRQLGIINKRLGLLEAKSNGLLAGTSFPTSPPTGMLFFRSDLGILYYYDGAAWQPVGATNGTYTPTYLGVTTAGVTTYTTQAGFYTQIGRVVFFNGRVVWTAATGTGVAIVSLPFTTDSTTNMRYGAMVRVNGVTFANGSVEANIQANVAFFSMESPLTNAAPTAINVEAAGDITFSGFFYR